jgi:hypothetical protein
MALQMYRYIILDNHKYVVATNTYNRKWTRAFSSQLAGNIIRLNFIDRGPGIRVYDMTLILANWAPGSEPYQDGITQTWDTQEQNLESSYSQVATVLQFTDPMGLSPGPSAEYGVYFTNFNLIIPQYSTPQKPYCLAEIEVTEATQVVA